MLGKFYVIIDKLNLKKMKKINIILVICSVFYSSQITYGQQYDEDALPIVESDPYFDQDSYTLIKTDKLSEIIKAAVEKDFPKATIAKAFTDNTGNYKLILKTGNTTKTVYTNARGEWFTPKNEGYN